MKIKQLSQKMENLMLWLLGLVNHEDNHLFPCVCHGPFSAWFISLITWSCVLFLYCVAGKIIPLGSIHKNGFSFWETEKMVWNWPKLHIDSLLWLAIACFTMVGFERSMFNNSSWFAGNDGCKLPTNESILIKYYAIITCLELGSTFRFSHDKDSTSTLASSECVRPLPNSL